jgi:leucyl/phenylalanyl-tRNA--protein transferase
VPWEFPPADHADDDGIVGIGADLEPETILAAYAQGLFPMPVRAGAQEVLAWWSPDPRGVLPLDGLVVSRSLRRSCARYEVTVDRAFEDVIDACGDPSRPGGWISGAVRDAYVRLHRLGVAHSFEAWSREDGSLAGGLYGIALRGLFAGESMFHRQRDASKVALVALVEALHGNASALLDVQWVTPHLASLGAVEIPRSEYLARLPAALAAPVPPIFQERS